MYKLTHGLIPSHVNVIVTEVEFARPPRRFSSRVRKMRQWWNEERLALLALSLGNACFLGLVLWWLW
ncbi:MAG: hypothetical protein FJ147_12135 [Deltaproteobacteria bacterium]|nr:hypothetical protein [Deltaproteobacteria bacterium]